MILGYANYWVFAALMLGGLYVMMVCRNLLRKLIGMYIMQTAVILFFISLSAKSRATVPILKEHAAGIVAVHYVNPLPHVLMLTAIVVGVSTLGMALALLVRIHRDCGTLEEDLIIKKLAEGP